MASLTFKNISEGPRVLNSNPPVVLQAGASTDGAVEISDAELRSMKATGYFQFDGSDAPDEAPEPGPLDQSIGELEAHIAGIDDVAEIDKLIEAETAGKSRKGALDALNARKAELEA